MRTPSHPFYVILKLPLHVEIAQSNITLLHVVKSLGEYLTSEEDDLRTKGSYVQKLPTPRHVDVSRFQASNSFL